MVDMTNDEANSFSEKEAMMELQMKLASENPNFVKFIQHSHVREPFLLRLPVDFCKLNLPKEDCMVTLVDESGVEYKTKYLAGRLSLSSGWGNFSRQQKLVVGDLLVFQLIEATKFKCILKRSERKEINSKLHRAPKRPTPLPSYPPEYIQALPSQVQKNKSCRQKTNTIYQFHACDKANSGSMKKAKKLQMKLAPELATFVKFMRVSHVGNSSWLKLPRVFCELYLPKENCRVTLIDESGKEYKTKYFSKHVALSAGWKVFSIANKLAIGDSVLFQLIEAIRFKVYIVRGNDLSNSEVAGVRAPAKESLMDERDSKPSKSPLFDELQEKNQDAFPPGSISNPRSPPVQVENQSDEVYSEDMEGIRVAIEIMEFRDVKSFEDFNNVVNGFIKDAELSVQVRMKYYELCCSQKAFLHDHLVLQGIDCKLIAGIISGFVNVADAIRDCRLATFQNDVASWDRSLNAFEQLGMNVGFLRARMHQAVRLTFETEGIMEVYSEAMFKRERLVEDIRNLELKLMESKEALVSYDKEIETPKLEADRYFKTVVNAPW